MIWQEAKQNSAAEAMASLRQRLASSHDKFVTFHPKLVKKKPHRRSAQAHRLDLVGDLVSYVAESQRCVNQDRCTAHTHRERIKTTVYATVRWQCEDE